MFQLFKKNIFDVLAMFVCNLKNNLKNYLGISFQKHSRKVYYVVFVLNCKKDFVKVIFLKS